MKVAVEYGKRTYGNSKTSKATEVNISGSSTCYIKIDFKELQNGRSWDWLSSGSVGGAKIELSMNDAKSLAKLILEYAEVSEKHDCMEYDVSGVLRLRDGHASETKIKAEPYEFLKN